MLWKYWLIPDKVQWPGVEVVVGSDASYCKVEQIQLKHSIGTLLYWGIGYKSI